MQKGELTTLDKLVDCTNGNYATNVKYPENSTILSSVIETLVVPVKPATLGSPTPNERKEVNLILSLHFFTKPLCTKCSIHHNS